MSEAFLFQGVAHEVHDPDMYIHPLIFNGWFKGTSRMSRTSLTYLLREVFMCDLTSLPPSKDGGELGMVVGSQLGGT